MARTPQILITLAHDDPNTLIAEYPTPNSGLRRHVPITSLSDIHLILLAQASELAAELEADISKAQSRRDRARLINQRRILTAEHRMGDGSVKVRLFKPKKPGSSARPREIHNHNYNLSSLLNSDSNDNEDDFLA